ncbi:translation initiation factor IF-2 [Neorickettsia risticii]
MDTKKRLSLNLKNGKEELSRRALREFIGKSSAGSNAPAAGSSGDRTSHLTRQEERNRLDALHRYRKANMSVAAQQNSAQEEVVEASTQTDPALPAGAKISSTRTSDSRLPEVNVQEGPPSLVQLDKPESDSSSLKKGKKGHKTSHHKDGWKNQEVRKRKDPLDLEINLQNVDGKDHIGKASLRSPSLRKKSSKSSYNSQPNTNPKRGQLIMIDKRSVTLRELSVLLSEPMVRMRMILKKMGEIWGEDDCLKQETVELLALELGHEIKYKPSTAEIFAATRRNTDESDLRPRVPVVTVMGHIDHGKTTLLDALRNTSLTATESGGITQHIGAYQVQVGDKSITFIDTPGHAAFTSMRMRGAKVTDIVVLVVAADDGVNEQTVEAIKHAKAADVPIIVAINKIDKEAANPARVFTELAQHGVIVEEMHGDVMSVNISAKNHTNLDKLKELILIQADFLDLKYNPKQNAEGVVIESRVDRKRGAFSTLIVKEGELKTGQVAVLGSFYGKIRSMMTSSGEVVGSAVAGTPVEVMGLSEAPEPGTSFFVVNSEKEAKMVVSGHEHVKGDSYKRPLRDSFESDKHKLNFIIKADVNGSVEALVQSISGLSHPEVDIAIIHTGIGDISDSDVLLAQVSGAYIVGFRVKTEKTVKDYPKIIFQSIIYDVIKKVQEMIELLVSPKTREVVLGSAVVKEVFTLSDKSNVAGCQVKSGVIKKSASIRLLRNGENIKDLSIKSLKRFREEVKEVKSGYECGILLNGYNEIKVGDILESFGLLSNEE